jgi:hypothetical protein
LTNSALNGIRNYIKTERGGMEMGKYITLLGGLISIIVGIWGLVSWWDNFVILLKGSVPLILILGGLAALFAGISEIKDCMQAKKEETKSKEEKK